MDTQPHPGGPGDAPSEPKTNLLTRLHRTISAERELLVHPLFGVGAARVMVRARAEIRRINRGQGHLPADPLAPAPSR